MIESVPFEHCPELSDRRRVHHHWRQVAARSRSVHRKREVA